MTTTYYMDLSDLKRFIYNSKFEKIRNA